jgi:hypothetical protein
MSRSIGQTITYSFTQYFTTAALISVPAFGHHSHALFNGEPIGSLVGIALPDGLHLGEEEFLN